MTLHPVSLDDKYDISQSRVFVTGYHALIRALLMQKERDRRAGLNTAGYVTGYRGSPLGGLDQQMARAGRQLAASDVKFQPGINEELAATALWGSQQAELRGEGKFDGVFGMWYGKGPGVDRSGDVFRHANMAGTSKNGGVIALMGDDHTAESSTTAHQSEFHFVDVMMPILNPAGVQEIVDYALYGWAMSRFTGTWTALKCMHETVESTGVIDGSVDRIEIVTPADFVLPEGGLNIRLVDTILGQEARLHDFKRDAMLAFLRANRLNRIVTSGGRQPKIGIATTGKAYLDVRQALDELGIDEVRCNDLGIRLFKIGCPWPIARAELAEFAAGLDLIIVVEEKRSLIEVQVREELYGTANQPVCVGKKDEEGNWLFPVKGALDPNDVAVAIGERILRYIGNNDEIAAHVARLKAAQRALAETSDVAVRIPYFCSGCPHNTSTRVPEGSRAYAGIGCHYMAQWMERKTLGFTQMGGEGANWIGEAPFSNRDHVFQNLGDGTYNHSGYLAIRAAIASGVKMTYKILYNDAVAMTGGQHHDGTLTVPQIARQVAAEGATRVVVVTDEPDKYPADTDWPRGLMVHHRDELDAVQRDLTTVPGVSVLIYDQTCAAEKRRRRKRGTFPDPDKRIVINDLVCEGCGDCGQKSNCVSVQPLVTEWGRKRTIDQSSCNKDYSCVKGFCPSFVTVHGAKLRKAEGTVGDADPLEGVPPARMADLRHGWAAIIDGVGGTGVVTVGAVLGMAAHLEGKGCGMIDMAGLAQKGGSVFSHVRIAKSPEHIHSIRVSAGKADLILGCDLVVSGAKKVLASVRRGETIFVVNTAEVMPGEFTRNADFSLPIERLKRAIRDAAGDDKAHFFDATKAANVLFGNAIGANMFMLGFACQEGGLPVSPEAVEEAIGMNGQAVDMNIKAFRWGRRAAHDPQSVQKLIDQVKGGEAQSLAQTLDEIIARRAAFLTGYQDAAYAQRYLEQVEDVRRREAAAKPGSTILSETVARNLFKLMAIKDEYEVARLYTDGSFAKQISQEFESFDRLEFHLAPPLFARRNKQGEPVKSNYGPYMMRAFSLLARMRRLRGTAFDPFSYLAERRRERALLAQYEADLATIREWIGRRDPDEISEFAAYPSTIRGFGHVKQKAVEQALRLREDFLRRSEKKAMPIAVAAE